jgi:UPF0755 protein
MRTAGSWAARTALLAGLLPAGCGSPGSLEPPPAAEGPAAGTITLEVPRGAGTGAVADSARARGLVDHATLFSLYLRLRGAADELKAGTYRIRAGAGWEEITSILRRGAVATEPLTVPPGFSVREIAPRVAELSRVPVDSVLALARDSALVRELGVPGPTLEGYLFPETYRFARGVAPRSVLATMVARYRSFWGESERARADSLGLSEAEVVTLASIVEEEARVPEERAVIAGVYYNRLDRGMRLEADPTVQFALGEPRERLLYRHIDQVADDPYNTYTHAGLPPGPIASPGAAALRAVLEPADVPYLFFVARPDGSHVFTRSLEAHNRARRQVRESGRLRRR